MRLLDLIFEEGPSYHVRTKLPSFTVHQCNKVGVMGVALSIELLTCDWKFAGSNLVHNSPIK